MSNCIPRMQTVPDGTLRVGESRRRETHRQQSAFAEAGSWVQACVRVHSGMQCVLESMMPCARSHPSPERGRGVLRHLGQWTRTLSVYFHPHPGHKEDRSHHIRSWHGLAPGILQFVLPWWRPSQKPPGCCLVPH